MDNAKISFLLTSIFLWIFFLLLVAIKNKIKQIKTPIKLKFSYIFILVFIVCAIIATIFSENKWKAIFFIGRFEGLITLLIYAFSFLGVSMFTTFKRKHMLALAFGLGGCCFISILQLLGYNPLWLFPKGINYYNYSQSFLGPLGNIDVFTAYLSFAVPSLSVFAIKSSNTKDRILLFLSVIGLVLLLKIGADAGILAIIVTSFIAIPMLITNIKIKKIVSLVFAVLIIITSITIYVWPKNKGTIYEMSQVMHGHFEDDFGTGRGIIWKQGIKLYLEHPWLGTGPGSTAQRFDIRWYRLNTGLTTYVENAHNTYLSYFINLGLFGGIAYILLVLNSLIIYFKKKDNMYINVLGIGIMCYLIQDFFSLNLFYTAPLLWIFMGLLDSSKNKVTYEKNNKTL